MEWTAPGPNPPAESLTHIYLQGSEHGKNICICIYIYIYMHFFMGRNMLMLMMEDLKQAPYKCRECPCVGDLPGVAG